MNLRSFKMLFFFLILSMVLTPVAFCGHLDAARMNLYLSYLGDSRDDSLRALCDAYEVPRQTIPILMEYLHEPTAPKSIAWADEVLSSTDEMTFQHAAALLIRGQSLSPPQRAGDVMRQMGLFDSFRGLRAISMFQSGLDDSFFYSFPRIQEEEPILSRLRNGFSATMSEDEAQEVLAELKSKVESLPVESEEMPEYTFLAIAYMNQSGDIGFLDTLWSSPAEVNKELVFIIAEMAEDRDVIRYAVERTGELPIQGVDYNLIPTALTMLRKHKNFQGVGERLREWLKEWDHNTFQPRQIMRIMAEPGWSQIETQLNLMALNRIILTYSPIIEIAQETQYLIQTHSAQGIR